jgi:hypothetical protein
MQLRPFPDDADDSSVWGAVLIPLPAHSSRLSSERLGRQKDKWAPVDTGLVAMNLYSSSGKVTQDGD